MTVRKGLVEEYYSFLSKLSFVELRRRQGINCQQLGKLYSMRGDDIKDVAYERLEAMRRALIAAVDHVAFSGSGGGE